MLHKKTKNALYQRWFHLMIGDLIDRLIIAINWNRISLFKNICIAIIMNNRNSLLHNLKWKTNLLTTQNKLNSCPIFCVSSKIRHHMNKEQARVRKNIREYYVYFTLFRHSSSQKSSKNRKYYEKNDKWLDDLFSLCFF